MKAKVIRDACIGCGACQVIAPNVFELDGEGISTVITDEIKEEDKKKAKDASESCPTAAIEITEE